MNTLLQVHESSKNCISFYILIILDLSLVENSGCFTWIKLQQLQQRCYLFLFLCAVFSCVQTLVWLSVFGIFNMHADIDGIESMSVLPLCFVFGVFWPDVLPADLSLSLVSDPPMLLLNPQLWCCGCQSSGTV